MKRQLFSVLVLLFCTTVVLGNIRLPAIFCDNMVLQREMKVPVWGWADPGEKIIVELGGHQSETVTGIEGKWKLYLGPLDTGGPFEMHIKGKNQITVKNILVGEVWVCSGQSNMAMEVRNSLNAKQEIATANYPKIRYFQVKRTKSLTPLDDVSPVASKNDSWLNKWLICSPATVANFTGVGYFFGRELHKKLGIPIGLISASWGGTTAEAWTPRDTLENNNKLRIILKNWPGYNNDEEWLKQEYEQYVKAVEQAHKEKKEMPVYFNQPTVLYNGILAPVVPFGIRGVTWYQGESNAYRAYQYRVLFPAMIQSWRRHWNQGNFPFLFVQLANYHFEPQVFPELREAQMMALSVPVTAMAVAIDVGDSANIHPKNKQEVGRRLSLAARKLAYEEELVYSGPVFRSMVIAEKECTLRFDHTGNGLTPKGSKTLSGFMVAGNDRKFTKAQAVIKGDEIVVWSNEVPNPVAVRYAWVNHPVSCNLYNKSDDGDYYLPASPFRTDDWPGITYDRK